MPRKPDAKLFLDGIRYDLDTRMNRYDDPEEILLCLLKRCNGYLRDVDEYEKHRGYARNARLRAKIKAKIRANN